MKAKLITLALALNMFACWGLLGCSLFTKQNANTALDAMQLACIFNSTVTQEEKLAEICSIATDLLPVIRKLVAQREAGRAAGVTWDGDAGARDAAKE